MAWKNCAVRGGQESENSPAVESLGPATVDRTRRRVLGWLSGVTGLVGVAIASIPFLESLHPSAKAWSEGAPVRVDLSGIPSGEEVTVIWRGHPVRILHRTPKMLEELANDRWRHELRDPNSNETTQQPTYAQNETRSIRSDHLVVPPHRYLTSDLLEIGTDAVA